MNGGTGQDSGKIVTGGDLNSLEIDGSLIGGIGGYSSTAESLNPQLGQVYAAGTIKSVLIKGNVQGASSSNSGEIRGGSIGKVVIGDFRRLQVKGLEGTFMAAVASESAAIVAESGDIQSVKITGVLQSGSGFNSGSIAAARNIGTVDVGEIEGQFSGCSGGTVNITAGGVLLPKSSAQALAIRSVTVHGNISFANILAGYDINGNAVECGRLDRHGANAGK